LAGSSHRAGPLRCGSLYLSRWTRDEPKNPASLGAKLKGRCAPYRRTPASMFGPQEDTITMSAQAHPAPQAPAQDASGTWKYDAALAGRIELKWQDRWEAEGTFEAPNPSGPLAATRRGATVSPGAEAAGEK